jgi:protein-L-isoaspartate(D-aspartate) O-methyltransferase
MIEDNYRHKGLRRKLVDELREKGITDARVLDAINKVPRHAFFDECVC